MVWAMSEEAPYVEIIYATFAISGEAAARLDVMEGRALTQANQHQSTFVRAPSLMAAKKTLEVSEGYC
jgi:hypothetical protein